MRWFDNSVDYEYGDKRIITKFALLPITIGKETRWLERVTIEQSYIIGGAGEVGFAGWVNDEFI